MTLRNYPDLIANFRRGELASMQQSELSPLESKIHELLKDFSRRDWPSFDNRLDSLLAREASETYSRIRGDLFLLKANSRFLQASYVEAAKSYEEARREYSSHCQLYTPELIEYNQYVIRSFGPGFSFRSEVPALSRIRRASVRNKDPFLAGLILNSYGNHYAQRGRFRRAFQLYRAAVRKHEQNPRLTNYLDAIGNSIRTALQLGELKEAERMIGMMNSRILEAGDTFMKERFNRVYAEFLFATERYDEALMHLDFSMNPSAPFESARMMLLKAQVLCILKKNGANDLLQEVGRIIKEHHLKDDALIDYHAVLAATQMEQGDIAGSYANLLKAESLAHSHHNSHLRAQVMLQKAKLDLLLGRSESAARIMLEVARLSAQQGFALLFFQSLRTLADSQATISSPDLPILAELLQKAPAARELPLTFRAIQLLRTRLEQLSPETCSHARPSRFQSSRILVSEGPHAGIFLERGTDDPQLLLKPHRMTGRLLVELLKEPNRDISLDQLHLRLWNGPIRNDSHVQKLKTLVSRLRIELRDKNLPIEIESREKATYRAVVPIPVKFQAS